MPYNNTHKSNRLELVFSIFNKNKITNVMFRNSYKTVSFDDKNLGVTRHYPPASKEWKDSVYSYNNKYIRDLPFKDERVSTLIRNHLSLIPAKKSTKSRRMRMLIRRSSTKNLFVSKPEIKQTSDKAIITVYLFDRQKQLFKNKLFMLYRKWFKGSSDFLANFKKKERSILKNKILRNVKGFFKRKIIRSPHNRKIYFKKKMYKYRMKPSLLVKKIMPSKVKRAGMKNDFFLLFLKWVLPIINIKISWKNLSQIKTDKLMFDIFGIKPKNDHKNEFLIKKDDKIIYKYDINGDLSFNYVQNMNIYLLRYLFVKLSKITSEENQKLNLDILFKEFKAKHYRKFLKKHLKNELLILKNLAKFNFTKRKSITMIDGLKNLIYKLYSKKVELNLVNLKYLHLNSDNFAEAITTKLKKKTGRLLRVLKKSFKLVKRPRKFSARLVTSKSIISKAKDTWKNNIKIVLNSLKYKWVTGVRLEAKGRLTRRFTASRAVYKFKYKGNLRNLEHLYNTNYKAKSPSVFMLRNQFRPNTQHSYKFSNKRIGSFGIKSWISGV